MANENALNAYLAEILRQAGIRTEVEYPFPINKRGKRLADLACFDVQGYTIGIEAKHGWGVKLASNKKASIAQADELVVNETIERKCHAAVALIYPDSYKTLDHLQNGKVKVAIRTPLDIRKQNKPEWNSRKVKDLPRFIKGIPSQLIGQPEELSKRAEIAVNQAFKMLSADADSIMDNLRQENPEELAKITNFKGLLVDLLTCFMFHYKLDTIIKDQPQFRKKAARPPTLQECIDSEDPIDSFMDAYDKWLKIDYTDILEWNIAILKALTISEHRGNDAVKRLAKTAQFIQRAKGAHHHDVVGITFCNAIEAAKQEGAMYTTLPAATLLTHLLFHKSKINWKNLEEVKSLRIVDFACGSGTLLIACANYILNYKLAEAKKKDREEVANALFEQMLYGYDCNQRAIFQTTTGLAMIAPSIAFKKTRLHAMPLGENPEKKGEVLLGSLEWLLGKDGLYTYPQLGQGIDRQPEPIECPTFRFAIMNPPYTRIELRYKQERFKSDKEIKKEKEEKEKKKEQSEIEKKLREREKRLLATNPAMTKQGYGGGFFALADKYIDQQNGKAGLVMSLSSASNSFSKATRLWLPKHFHIQYIIVSYDLERIFFSGNTRVGEMLLVLQRKKKKPTPTQVIKLTNNPVHESDAFICAQAISRGEQVEEWGEVDEIQPDDMAKGDWSATQFLSNDLYRIAKQIPNHWTSSFEKQVKIKTLGGFVRDVKTCKHPGELHATPCLRYHDTKYCDKLEVKPDCHVKPKEMNSRYAHVLQKTSRLKIAWLVHLPTIKNFACRTTVPSAGSSWSTAEVAKKITNVDKETVEKAVCLILNSTPAKLGAILARVNKKPSYPRLSVSSWNRIPMPLLSGMSVSAFRALAKVYDEYCKQPRKRLPEAHTCLVQLAIDKAVCQHTGFPEDICKKARHLLAQEPMVTGQRYQANPKETNPQLF